MHGRAHTRGPAHRKWGGDAGACKLRRASAVQARRYMWLHAAVLTVSRRSTGAANDRRRLTAYVLRTTRLDVRDVDPQDMHHANSSRPEFSGTRTCTLARFPHVMETPRVAAPPSLEPVAGGGFSFRPPPTQGPAAFERTFAARCLPAVRRCSAAREDRPSLQPVREIMRNAVFRAPSRAFPKWYLRAPLGSASQRMHDTGPFPPLINLW